MDIVSCTNDTFHAFKRLAKVLQNEKYCKICSLGSDHGEEFQNLRFDFFFFNKHGIKHNFSDPINPQQKGVVERMNIYLKD